MNNIKIQKFNYNSDEISIDYISIRQYSEGLKSLEEKLKFLTKAFMECKRVLIESVDPLFSDNPLSESLYKINEELEYIRLKLYQQDNGISKPINKIHWKTDNTALIYLYIRLVNKKFFTAPHALDRNWGKLRWNC